MPPGLLAMASDSMARWQLASTTVYHFIFVPVSIGLGLLVASMQTLAYRKRGTEDGAAWDRAGRFFGKLLLMSFAIGVVTVGQARPLLIGVLAAAGLATFDALSGLPAAFAALGRCLAGVGRVEQVLSQPWPVAEPLFGAEPPATLHVLDVDGVTLAPAPDAPPVLVRADLVVLGGQRVAVVGPSGSGKSTLMAGILRLLTPSAGAVRLDGTPVTALAADAVPPLAAGSLQGDHVFSATLRDNLRVVAPDATAGRTVVLSTHRAAPLAGVNRVIGIEDRDLRADLGDPRDLVA